MFRLLLAAIILMAWIGSARAQGDFFEESTSEVTPTTATYQFNGNESCPTRDDRVTGPVYRLRFSQFGRSGVKCKYGQAVFNSTRWNAGDAVSFTVQPVAEHQMVIGEDDSLTFWMQRSADGPADFQLTYQIAGGETHVIKDWALGGHETEIRYYEADLPEVSTTREVRFAIETPIGASHWQAHMLFDDVTVQLGTRAEKTSTGISTSAAEQPEKYRLLENYPNPFNPSTTIPLVLPEAAPVRLTLHNSLGERMHVLIDRRLSAGRHEARLNAQDLASGTYFVRMSAGTFRQTRTLDLVK